MAFVYATVVGNQDTYERVALPGIVAAGGLAKDVLELHGQVSMMRAYNAVLDKVGLRDGIEALVLIHEDTELCDPDFEDRVRALMLRHPDCGVIGVIGARRPRSLAWWQGEVRGRVTETRWELDHGIHCGEEVDVVDGLLMVLTPPVIRDIRYATEIYPDSFHAYDSELCCLVRAAGFTVRLLDTRVVHHTKAGYGDRSAWRRADRIWRRRWKIRRNRLRGPRTG